MGITNRLWELPWGGAGPVLMPTGLPLPLVIPAHS